MRANKMREYILEKIETLGVDTYYRNASNDSIYPYATFDLKSNFFRNDIYDVEINLWDNNTSLYSIEDLADSIEDLLDKDINLSENGLLVFDKLSRGYIDDPNKNLNRIMIKFNMRYFK